jgi:hypothetical protein
MNKNRWKKNEDYRELWNMLNTESNCLQERINQNILLKDWIERRLTKEELPKKEFENVFNRNN